MVVREEIYFYCPKNNMECKCIQQIYVCTTFNTRMLSWNENFMDLEIKYNKLFLAAPKNVQSIKKPHIYNMV